MKDEAKGRIDAQPAFILHSHPYSETSLIIDVFTRDHGRLPLLARGARRPRAALRGLLQAFQPLELGWFGRGEVRTLAKAEWQGGMPLLAGPQLMLGYYLNELLLRLLPRDDAHPVLFERYWRTLTQLARAGAERLEARVAAALREFEKHLLAELGYGLELAHDVDSGAVLEAEAFYHYLLEHGPVAVARPDGGVSQAAGAAQLLQAVHGKTLLDLARDDYSDPRTLQEARQLMRRLINHHLSGAPLQSRRVFMDLQEL